MRPNLLELGCAALACGAALWSPQHASACGGFFCDNSQPVNQSAERILFARGADGALTAVIQIQYAGPAENFAWVLPVAGNPEVSVSSNAAFARLQGATNPQYTLTTRVEGTCIEDDAFRGGGPSAADGLDASAGAQDAGSSPVTVVDGGSVGPYDYVVIAVDPSATPLADVAVEWLNANDFDIDASGAALLEPYLAGGMNLLAFRLSKGNDTGSIRPVMIGFGTGLATIPIRPTAVAAVEDMGVLVWVLGEHRAVPVNYRSLELNEALINWINPSTSYDAVVNAAANEAGGQGFVTEMAGPASPLAQTIFADFERSGWAAFETTSWTGREGELINTAVNQFGSLDGMRDAFAAAVPLPSGAATLDDLLACVSCYIDWSLADLDGFEPSAFLAAIEANVIEPMERTRALFEAQPYVTRFYTTMSAAEMTVDPSFDFNADLGDVSNIHNAERVIECSPSVSQFQAPWRVNLPNGEVVTGMGNTWPFTPGEDMPANAIIRRVGTEGEGEVIEDNTARISVALDEHNAELEPVFETESGCACRASHGSSSPAWILALGALGAVLALRKRR